MNLELTPEDTEAGLVKFRCHRHGPVAITYPTAQVTCRCGRRCTVAITVEMPVLLAERRSHAA